MYLNETGIQLKRREAHAARIYSQLISHAVREQLYHKKKYRERLADLAVTMADELIDALDNRKTEVHNALEENTISDH